MTTTLRRPSRLTVVAGALLATGGALFVAEVLLSADKYFTDMTTYDQAVADGLVKNDTAWAAVGVLLHAGAAAVGVLIGALLVVLAVFAGLGQSWARMVGWLLGVPILLWYGVLAVLSMALTVVSGPSADPDPPELTRRFVEAWPPWLGTLDLVLMVLTPLTLIVALVCQTVPTDRG